MRRVAVPQRGVALVCALMLTLVAGVLGVAVGRLALMSLAAAQFERDHAVARAAADAALADAERDIGAAGPDPDPPAAWAGQVAYGERTGARMAVGSSLLPARLPTYTVERLPGAAPPHGAVYRITATGVGTRPATEVVVQALYRGQAGTVPAARLGWRELANPPAPAAGNVEEAP